MAQRSCTRTGCPRAAVATLTYVYADQTAVVGPLAPEHVPGSYDLCREHCDGLSAPRGWQVVRRPDVGQEAPPPARDDLLALADAVREVGMLPEERAHAGLPEPQAGPESAEVVVLAEKRHLRVVADAERHHP